MQVGRPGRDDKSSASIEDLTKFSDLGLLSWACEAAKGGNMYGVELFTGEPERPYQVLGEVWAKQDDGNIEDCNAVLIEQATQMGADGIINLNYQRKVSLFSFSQLNAKGIAVKFESQEIECPVCAEMIKRAAKKCRFCQADLT